MKRFLTALMLGYAKDKMIIFLITNILGYTTASMTNPSIKLILGYSAARVIATCIARILGYTMTSNKSSLIVLIMGYTAAKMIHTYRTHILGYAVASMVDQLVDNILCYTMTRIISQLIDLYWAYGQKGTSHYSLYTGLYNKFDRPLYILYTCCTMARIIPHRIARILGQAKAKWYPA
jgi:hypothetical protein